MARKAKTYVVSDGALVLHMREDEGGWYCVTSPLDPGLVTQARSIPEAFEMARDALAGLRKARAKYATKLRQSLVA